MEPVWIDPPSDIKPRAIPEGVYRVAVWWSEKHHMNVPWVLDVPDFEDIEIRPGNFPNDTLACLLVGMGRFPNVTGISSSVKAWYEIFDAIMSAIQAHKEVWIEYKNGWSVTA